MSRKYGRAEIDEFVSVMERVSHALRTLARDDGQTHYRKAAQNLYNEITNTEIGLDFMPLSLGDEETNKLLTYCVDCNTLRENFLSKKPILCVRCQMKDMPPLEVTVNRRSTGLIK